MLFREGERASGGGGMGIRVAGILASSAGKALMMQEGDSPNERVKVRRVTKAARGRAALQSAWREMMVDG